MITEEQIKFAAFEAFPENISHSTISDVMYDYNAEHRRIWLAGADWAFKNLQDFWVDAHGKNLPEYDEEVIVLIQDWDDEDYTRVAFGHRPNPKGWTGKSLSTGKIEHFTPKTFGKGGWNLANIKYWLNVKLPKNLKDGEKK